MARFEEYIGIDYSGRRTPTTPMRALHVYAAEEDHEVRREIESEKGLWSRQTLAEWLLAKLTEDHPKRPKIVGIDHAFSFPRSYLERHSLHSWEEFLKDFTAHWPTHSRRVRDLREGNLRNGHPEELRLTERWTPAARGVFRFEMRGGAAKAAHAGLPWLDYLRQAGSRVHFWPFDGFEVPAGKSVVVEVYPDLFCNRYPVEGRSTEEHAAYSVCAWLRERDQLGLLEAYFHPPLSASEKERARLEGWIFGLS
ncbi:MAG TPA: hypothetical protein VMM92_12755 [Thermoanaerobaculia bacterium]|nr:hypothetical protein [Thermoanaerobaculia bacterium]